ncbi:uncharacterized protein [Haliotis cracherodii]|uniref:uncharacterized protein n=1 Tax=Haliotis cracherodii TaxID=6455 RepID=UPI0039EBFA29
MAASVKTAELKKAIKNILKDADLDSLSAKKVRRKLEDTFGIDLTARKQEIDALTMKMITEGQEEEEKEEQEEEPKSKSRKTTNIKSKGNDHMTQNGRAKKDTSDAEDMGDDSDSSFDAPDPVPVIKKRKVEKKPQPKKTSDSALSDDDDDEVDDEVLAKQLQQEEEMNLRTRRRPQKKPVAPRKPKEKKERKGTSMYSKPCQLSPELAAVIGQDQLSRHEIVKRMWEVMRERELQDPKNKQFMVCDEELQKIFGRKRVRMFGMMKWLTKHIRSMDDLE